MPKETDKIRIGISTCLLGEPVRYDGGHKLDRYLRDTLGTYVEYVPVCPEVECGLPVPRPAMRLVGDPSSPRLVTRTNGEDKTDQMKRWAENKLEELEALSLCGFIFKSGSPSSGMERVRVYGKTGMPSKVGVGIFARAFLEHFPSIPAEEEGRLHDPILRENFIERIFTMKRWRAVEEHSRSRGGLVEFHTRNKLLILSHSPKHYRELGKLVASAKEYRLDALFNIYRDALMEALQLKATARKNTNVLQHIMGYFKKVLEPGEKAELVTLIDQYRNGYIPLIVPITLLKHYVEKFSQPYLEAQTYLQPHPLEMKLRNHV